MAVAAALVRCGQQLWMLLRLCRWISVAGLVLRLGALNLTSQGQSSTHTRIFRSAGAFPSGVSVAATGSVVAKSGDTSLLTLLDGFTRRDVSIPEEITYRVYESRSGQLWTVTSQGLLLFHTGSWTLYALPEIRAFLNIPTRNLRQITLLPAEVNHVLVLFPDKLLDFDALTRQTRLLKEASSTQLGEFTAIQEGVDDVWISGADGIARLQGPARRVGPESPWEEMILPDTNRVNSLQRVFERAGELTCSANCVGSENRAIVHWRAGQWSTYTLPGEKVREAWRSWDDSVWGFSTTSLFRIGESGLRHEAVSGALYDVAVETNGVFWVASGEGLIRYAPQLWRVPPQLEDIQSSVPSLLLSPGGSNIFISSAVGLVEQTATRRWAYPWPEELENLPPRQIFRLADGRILIEGESRPLVLDHGHFIPVETTPAAHVHLVGSLRDGSVCAWFEQRDRESPLDIRVFRAGRFEPIELPRTNLNRGEVSFIREGSNGDLWLGQGATLLRYRRDTRTLERHGPENGLRTDRIYALAEVGEGRIWCGSAARIYEMHAQRWEPILNTVDRVTDIRASQGSIWVSTLSGVHRFFENSWLLYSTREGLPSGAIYSLRLGPDDQLWAGTSRGVFVFHPDADSDPPRALSPALDEVDKPAAGEPVLVHFRGQDKWDYTFPSDLLFAYRLDESGWTPYSNVTSRLFQKLPAGNHLIEVLAMDKSGNRASSPGRLEFAVIVPWFHDPRLVLVSLLALCSSLVLAALAVNKHFELKRSYARVEQIVTERTRELDRANQELLHSQKMRALGTMAAGIAHDFNNILSIIKGSAQIIENNIQDQEKIQTRVSRIQTVVEQGTVIVKALLGLGKTEQKDLSDCNLHDLLHQTRKLLGDRFPETIQFQVNAAPDLPLVHCAPEVLQQILLNLILNAAEAMHNEGVVELSATVTTGLPAKMVLEPPLAMVAPSSSCVLLSVIDQGGGISPEILPRIFEPFFTTKAFSTRRGTGLGLSMVYEQAKAQGYGISVTTKPGTGSSLTIVIPILPKPTSM